jgi:Na+-translocating ferredoxin:NAD+ oxidoreductase subunit D
VIRPRTTSAATTTVLLALAPGAAVQTALFGAGTAANVAVALVTAVAVEAGIARLRGQSPIGLLRDGSACITASLIALSLPPGVPLPIVIGAVVVAIALAKHAFGGAGNNPFNPAMVGYAAILLCFPHLLVWPDPSAVDAVTAPTALDAFKHRGGQTVADVWTRARGFGALGGANWEWLNAAYLAGGIGLVALRVVDWRIPVAILATVCALAAAAYDGGSSSSLGSPLLHCFSGGTMLGAFFVATDPVTCPTSPRGRVYFAIVLGATLFLVRTSSVYPDGIAFAVLIANAAAPLLDRFVEHRSNAEPRK